MAPKTKNKNTSKKKDKKSISKSTTPIIDFAKVQRFPDDLVYYEMKGPGGPRNYDKIFSQYSTLSNTKISTKHIIPLTFLSTDVSKPSSLLTKSSSSPRLSLSPTRSTSSSSLFTFSSPKLSLSPTRSNPMSNPSTPRLSLSPTRGSPRLFEEQNVPPLDSKELSSIDNDKASSSIIDDDKASSLIEDDKASSLIDDDDTKALSSIEDDKASFLIDNDDTKALSSIEDDETKALSSIDNDESGWTQITKKGLSKKMEQSLDKNRGYFLSNQLSPLRTPPNEISDYIQDERLDNSSNRVKILSINSKLTNIVGLDLQMKSLSSPTVLKRPLNKGLLGVRVEVVANLFKCTKFPNENISTYNFEFEPPIKSTSLRWTIKRDWESKYGDTHLGGKCVTYDGLNLLYINQPLSFTTRSFTYEHYDKKEGLKTYKINISLNSSQEHAMSLQPFLLRDYINNQSDYCPQSLIRALNLTLRQNICVGDIELQNVLFPTLKNNVTKGSLGMPNIRVLQGYLRNLKPTQQGLALNVDTCQRLFHEKSNVLDFLKNMLEYKEDIQNMKNILDINKYKVLRALKGLIVETNHYTDKISRNHKVIGITDESIRTLIVETRDGQRMSMKNYYQENYQQKIVFLDLPCLILSSNTKNYMPIELCFIVKNQMVRDDKSFEGSQRFTKIMLASKRIQVISNFVKEVFKQRNDHPKSFDLEFDVKPIRTIARILPPPILVEDSTPYEHLFHWGVLNLSQKTNHNAIEEFINELIRELKKMTMTVLKYQYTNGALFKTLPIEFMEAFYKKISDSIPEKKKSDVNLIVVIVDGKKRNSYYNEIKYWGDCIKGVPTQVIASDLISRPKMWGVYVQRIGMKINCRLGGVNVQFRSWNEIQIKERVIKDIKYGRFIAFGADVTHPEAGSNNPSLAAIVMSLDYGCCYFGARFFAQDSGQEIMTSKLDSTITELLLAFKTYNNKKPLPQNILYYRDGVGDSQFEDVLKVELPQIQQGASAAELGYKPLISFIIVQKRHRTRFFLPEALTWDEKYAATLGVKKINIKPGTVVDNDVCDPQKFDFYLCSHYAVYGTPRPSHYFVIYDDANFSVDDFQNITHYLCHIYQRSITSVSMPTPAYYAHLAAFRARQIYSAAQAIRKRRNNRASMSSTTTSRSYSTSTDIMDLPNIHENHKLKMFFI